QAMPYRYNDQPAILAVGRDVTQRRVAEDALRRSERRFRDLAESASDYLWEMDEQLRFSYISRDESWFTGSAARVIGRGVEDMPPHATDLHAMQRHLDDLHAHRPFRDFIYS